MKKIKLYSLLALSMASSPLPLVSTTSCNNKKQDTKSLEDLLKSLDRVSKVEKLEDKKSYNARYMIYFNHPLDWSDQSKGSFLQRVELDFRGYDRVNQLFTCGYELRQEKPDRMNDYEIANHFQGNIIKPEYRFFDKSRPEGLDNSKIDLWQYLTNSQAAADFHSMISSFSKILTNKWVFSGTSKGGETTCFYAMTYPNDCALYVPYVAPIFYKPQSPFSRKFIENVYGNIGYDILGNTVAEQYHTEIAKFQLYALSHKESTIATKGIKLWQYFWSKFDLTKYRDFVRSEQGQKIVLDMCICESATAFWQYNQNISQLIEFNKLDDNEAKLIACGDLIAELNDPTGWEIDSLFFPYYVQAATEMGEYTYDFKEMIQSIKDILSIDVDSYLTAPEGQRDNLLFKTVFTDQQLSTFSFDETSSNKLKEWWHTCQSNVLMVYGGADTWTALGYNDTNCGSSKSDKIKVFIGKDPVNASGRTHLTRITTLSASDQRDKIWPYIENILK